MGNISFVILNYKAYEEAIACAESVLATQTWEDMKIVIVDNGSKNGSAEQLREHFNDEPRVHVIAADENLGFARGNNLGIRYVREQFDPDFIVAANSDILFEEEVCGRIAGVYARRPFAILGGDIVDATRTQHLNPVARERSYTLNYMRKQVLVSWVKAVLFRLIKLFHLKRTVAGHYGIIGDEGGAGEKEDGKKLTTREVDGKAVSADSRETQELEGVLLHGCCLVFSRDFFAEFDGFWEGTFLYAEEEILYYLAMKKGLRVLYAPEVFCMHKEAVTTHMLYRDFCDAKIFYFSNITKSYRRFLKLMKEYE
ncbi:MAG: glycosyltransferase [Clostridiales bacterium]|nr:glycosyltransferase [Clostridiales bacterium]